MIIIKEIKWRCSFEWGQKTEKSHQQQRPLIAIRFFIYRTDDKWTPFHQYLSFLVLTIRHYLFKNYTGGCSNHRVRRGGFTKFAPLVQFSKLSIFPCFIISDANHHLITYNSFFLLWPFSRCNKDPVCRNPCCFTFRMAAYIGIGDRRFFWGTRENREFSYFKF